ncbi:alpha/beta hydrolase fold domain-containing protein, partial [Azospirillum brasilense]|uniref:alpha/beta hydrolase fold domain-containing protein n=1 Tax=Azospirillum brasilense TaxID=192 RepID=UPI001FFFBDB7
MPDTILRPTTERLDPQVIAMNEAAARLGAAPADPLSLPLADARAAAERYHAFLNGPVPLAVDVTEVAAAGPSGPLALRLYRPADHGAARLPVLVYFHGGGFVVNSVDTHDRLLRMLALHSGVVVCAVRYSLAPERRFPHQHEEALAALRWIAAAGAVHGIDPGRIAVGGDSAGANLALGLALAARAPGEPRVSFGLLFYGMFAHDFDTVSHRRFGDGRYGLTTARMRWYEQQTPGSAANREGPRPTPWPVGRPRRPPPVA